MDTSIKSLVTAVATAFAAVAAVAICSLPALADEPPKTEAAAQSNDAKPAATMNDEQKAAAGLSGNWYFTDELGNRREPTAAEVRELAQAFEKDLARLAGKHKGKHHLRKYPNGTVSATVALSNLEFLVVRQNDDGTLTYGHATMNEDGIVEFQPATNLPEM